MLSVLLLLLLLLQPPMPAEQQHLSLQLLEGLVVNMQ
jgi:hypothetical protein